MLSSLSQLSQIEQVMSTEFIDLISSATVSATKIKMILR